MKNLKNCKGRVAAGILAAVVAVTGLGVSPLLSGDANADQKASGTVAAANKATDTKKKTAVKTVVEKDDTNDDWLHCVGNQIYDEEGNPVYLTGVNWFGFNCNEAVVHGLWSMDFDVKMKEIADRGFNLLRIPISSELILQWKAGEKVKVCITSYNQPELQDENGKDLDSRGCFDVLLKYCKMNGIKVMMDCHSLDTNNSGHNYPVWYGVEAANLGKTLTEDDWIEAWTWFVDQYKDDDTVVAIDLKNEPHGKYSDADNLRAKWDGSDDQENWQRAASRCGKAILDINPNLLIMVEGIEQTPRPGYTYESGTQSPNATEKEKKYYPSWWGGNLRGAKDYPVDLGKYQSQLVYSPHDYGPAVYNQSWFQKDFTEQTLLDDYWYDTWYYLQDQNISPLLIGEWGGFMDGKENQKWLELIAAFIEKNKINHTFWCLNPNSGDTGGLLDATFQNWDEEKYGMMKDTLWHDEKTGKFIGLDHKVPLGDNLSVSEYYAGK
jgi:aryl-phospho-beta-D-glucosidase BglC (GH1 family)